MLFNKKKINTETLAEYLTSVRHELHLELEDAASLSGVNAKFLENLENGNFTNLPPDIYVCGFLQKIALVYAIEPDLLIKQFKKEKGIVRHVLTMDRAEEKFGKFKKIVITPKVITGFILGLFMFLTLGYIAYEVRSVNTNPNIKIVTPVNGGKVEGSIVRVSGTTDVGNELTVNGRQITVDSSGYFDAPVSIGPGQTVLEVVAKNKFSKTKSEQISLVNSSVQQSEISAPVPAGINFTIEALNDLQVSVVIDGSKTEEYNITKGQGKQVVAKENLLFSTSDAGSTRLTVNGQRIGVIGRVGERIENIPFSVNNSLLVKNSLKVNNLQY